jgi:hypothetical protein
MADLNDVGVQLVAIATQAVYPNGTGQASISGTSIRLGQGWPDPQQLDQDLAAGINNVTVYPLPSERNTSRYPKAWVDLSVNTPSLTATVSGQTITIAGLVPNASNPTNISIVYGKPSQYALYAVQPTDTTTTIATALASQIPGATNTGAVITAPATTVITAARVGVNGISAREVRRQEKHFQITVWADTPDHRTAIATAIDMALVDLQFITLSDTFAARVKYLRSVMNDGTQVERLYRRDLIYSVEYATTETTSSTQVTQEVINDVALGLTTTQNL